MAKNNYLEPHLEKLTVSGKAIFIDGVRLIRIKKPIRKIMPSLTDRKKEIQYRMDILFTREQLKKELKSILHKNEAIPILLRFEEIKNGKIRIPDG